MVASAQNTMDHSPHKKQSVKISHEVATNQDFYVFYSLFYGVFICQDRGFNQGVFRQLFAKMG